MSEVSLYPRKLFDFYRVQARGKSPVNKSWQSETLALKDIELHLRQGGNIGGRLRAGIVVVDADRRNYPKGRDSLREFLDKYSLDIETIPRVQTGNGTHLFFSLQNDVALNKSWSSFVGLDFLTEGASIICAPSVHENNTTYTWRGKATIDNGMPPLPYPVVSSLGKIRTFRHSQYEAHTITVQSAIRLLNEFDITDFGEGNYEDFFRLGASFHYTTRGDSDALQAFLEWAATDPAYDNENARNKNRIMWKNYQISENETGKTLVQANAFLALARKYCTEKTLESIGMDTGIRASAADLHSTLEHFNRSHAKVLVSGKSYVLKETSDEETAIRRSTGYQLITKRDFLEHENANRIPTLVPRKNGELVTHWKPLAELWLDWYGVKTYNEITFKPTPKGGIDTTPQQIYNTWKGWSFVRMNRRIDKFEQFVDQIICSGNVENQKYLWRWLAWMVQRPDELPDSAIILQGGKGVGKSTFTEAIARMCSPYSVTLTGKAGAFGTYNALWAERILVIVEELEWGDNARDNKSSEAFLKRAVTDETIQVEEKFQPKRIISNFAHVIATTNADRPVPVSYDERRYFVLQVGKGRTQPTAEFFKQLHEEDLGPDGITALRTKLLDYEIPADWHPRNPPVTDALRIQMEMSEPTAYTWWRTLIQERDGSRFTEVAVKGGAMTYGEWEEKPARLGVRRMYKEYTFSSKSRNRQDIVEESVMLEQLLKVMPAKTELEKGSRGTPVLLVPPMPICADALDNARGRPNTKRS